MKILVHSRPIGNSLLVSWQLIAIGEHRMSDQTNGVSCVRKVVYAMIISFTFENEFSKGCVRSIGAIPIIR